MSSADLEYSTAGGVSVQDTVRRLRAWRHVERSMVRACAAWFLRVPAYEVKIELGHRLWAHAERAEALGIRLMELRGGHHDANVEPALMKLSDELIDAPNTACFLTGCRTALGLVATGYEQYLTQADPAANAAELRLLRSLSADTRRSFEELSESIELTHAEQDPLTVKWADYLARLAAMCGFLNTAAGQSDVSPDRPSPDRYVRPETLLFDDRIERIDFESYDQRMELPFEQRRVAECQIFFNEVYAAALLATVILDAWGGGAPWAFFYDMSHHFWDEVRHAQFGVIRLKELGVEPSKVNLVLFDAATTMPVLHRLCYLTLGLEVYFMPRKQPRVKRYEEAGDPRTQLFADVDWSDEGNHVKYGKRWVNHFLENDARSVPDIQDEIDAFLKEAGVNLPEGKPAPY